MVAASPVNCFVLSIAMPAGASPSQVQSRSISNETHQPVIDQIAVGGESEGRVVGRERMADPVAAPEVDALARPSDQASSLSTSTPSCEASRCIERGLCSTSRPRPSAPMVSWLITFGGSGCR